MSAKELRDFATLVKATLDCIPDAERRRLYLSPIYDAIEEIRNGDSRKTNVEMIEELMQASPSGALIEPFVVTAISNYSEMCIQKGPREFDNSMMNGSAWIRCAEHSLKWYQENYNARLMPTGGK